MPASQPLLEDIDDVLALSKDHALAVGAHGQLVSLRADEDPVSGARLPAELAERPEHLTERLRFLRSGERVFVRRYSELVELAGDGSAIEQTTSLPLEHIMASVVAGNRLIAVCTTTSLEPYIGCSEIGSSKVLWRHDLPRSAGAVAATTERAVYSDRGGALVCVATETGEEQWRWQSTDPDAYIDCAAIVEEVHVWFAAGSEAYCLRLESGAEVWRRKLEIQDMASLRMHGERLVILNQNYVELDKCTGAVECMVDLRPSLRAAGCLIAGFPSLWDEDSFLFCDSAGGGLYRLQRHADGVICCDEGRGERFRVSQSPLRVGDDAYLLASSGRLYALSSVGLTRAG